MGDRALEGAIVASKYRAIYRNGVLLAEYEGGRLTYLAPEYVAPKRADFATPYIMRDIGEYQSPLDGSMITSRSAHREHMRVHDVVEVGNERIGNPMSAEPGTDPVEFGQAVKRRLEEVAAMPQREYDAHVTAQQAEHAEVASLVTAG